jgi:hypothetical protein
MHRIGNVISLMSIVSVLGGAGCSIAPITNLPTGRTVGAGKVGLDLGAIMASEDLSPGFASKLSIGLMRDLDFGFEYEVISLGAFLKYSLINPIGDGPALAVHGGLGQSGSTYYYGGVTGSLKLGAMEPFGVIRYNHAEYQEITSSIFTIPAGSYNYWSFSGGTAIWIVKWFGLKGEVSFLSGNFGTSSLSKPLFDGAIMFRF